MDALLMCGGRGTRLDAPVEKPLVEVGGVPMVDRVRAALDRSRVETVYAVVSPRAPATRDHLSGELPLIEAAGEGYVADLSTALERASRPALTVAADLPLIEGDAVDRALDAAAGSTTVVVPAALKRALGVSVDAERSRRWVPAGVNVVDDGPDEAWRTWDARFAVNANRKGDVSAAERLRTDDGP